MDEHLRERQAVSRYQTTPEGFAQDLFSYNISLAARMALGHGISNETVAELLEGMAAAVRTGDCAEDTSPISDGHNLEQLFG
jgi:hypothetical protein